MANKKTKKAKRLNKIFAELEETKCKLQADFGDDIQSETRLLIASNLLLTEYLIKVNSKLKLPSKIIKDLMRFNNL